MIHADSGVTVRKCLSWKLLGGWCHKPAVYLLLTENGKRGRMADGGRCALECVGVCVGASGVPASHDVRASMRCSNRINVKNKNDKISEFF